ncbi:MAG TPA: hypothetical protein PLJ25_04415 [Methanothrix sp.]|nr:hypothetical protein [Methanothrix sp.]
MTKQEVLEEIVEELASISDSLAGIHEEMEEISMTNKIMVILKMTELRPEMKEKMGPLIDEMAATMDMTITEDEDEVEE